LAQSTIEVRWFLDGPADEIGREVKRWFRTRLPYGGGEALPIAWDPPGPAWRADRYLLVPGQDDMGIKWREGRLEIKGREAALGHRAFSPGIEGVYERWIKWSYAGKAIERRFLGLFQGGVAPGIVRVEKRRLQRCIALDATGGVEVGRDPPPPRGVNVELARIRVPGSPSESHSLAFEAFPGDARMLEQLTAVVARFLEGCPALPLRAERSMSYPRWLLDLDRPAPTAR
jgi:hypothetical protein